MIGKNALSVGSVIAGVILLLLCIVAFLVSKTGLLSIPLFSRWYASPAPVRVVTAAPMDPSVFRVLVSGRVLEAAKSGTRPPYIVSLSERELSGAVQGVIDQALRTESWKTERVQLAISKDVLELTGRFTQGPWHVDARVRFIPIVEQGGIRFEPVDIHIGEFPIHPQLARRIAGSVFARDFGTWKLTYGDIQFQSVTLRDGAIDLAITTSTP